MKSSLGGGVVSVVTGDQLGGSTVMRVRGKAEWAGTGSQKLGDQVHLGISKVGSIGLDRLSS